MFSKEDMNKGNMRGYIREVESTGCSSLIFERIPSWRMLGLGQNAEDDTKIHFFPFLPEYLNEVKAQIMEFEKGKILAVLEKGILFKVDRKLSETKDEHILNQLIDACL